MYIKQLIALLISCSLFACAGTESSTGDESEGKRSRTHCIFSSSIRGYTVLDESNLIVDISRRRSYHVTLLRRAYGLRSSWSIGFDSPTGRICAQSSKVVFGDRRDIDSISIRSIRELSPEEREDILIRYGKKEPEIKQTPVPRDVSGAEVEELDPAADDSSSN